MINFIKTTIIKCNPVGLFFSAILSKTRNAFLQQLSDTKISLLAFLIKSTDFLEFNFPYLVKIIKLKLKRKFTLGFVKFRFEFITGYLWSDLICSFSVGSFFLILVKIFFNLAFSLTLGPWINICLFVCFSFLSLFLELEKLISRLIYFLLVNTLGNWFIGTWSGTWEEIKADIILFGQQDWREIIPEDHLFFQVCRWFYLQLIYIRLWSFAEPLVFWLFRTLLFYLLIFNHLLVITYFISLIFIFSRFLLFFFDKDYQTFRAGLALIEPDLLTGSVYPNKRSALYILCWLAQKVQNKNSEYKFYHKTAKERLDTHSCDMHNVNDILENVGFPLAWRESYGLTEKYFEIYPTNKMLKTSIFLVGYVVVEGIIMYITYKFLFLEDLAANTLNAFFMRLKFSFIRKFERASSHIKHPDDEHPTYVRMVAPGIAELINTTTIKKGKVWPHLYCQAIPGTNLYAVAGTSRFVKISKEEESEMFQLTDGEYEIYPGGDSLKTIPMNTFLLEELCKDTNFKERLFEQLHKKIGPPTQFHNFVFHNPSQLLLATEGTFKEKYQRDLLSLEHDKKLATQTNFHPLHKQLYTSRAAVKDLVLNKATEIETLYNSSSHGELARLVVPGHSYNETAAEKLDRACSQLKPTVDAIAIFKQQNLDTNFPLNPPSWIHPKLRVVVPKVEVLLPPGVFISTTKEEIDADKIV